MLRKQINSSITKEMCWFFNVIKYYRNINKNEKINILYVVYNTQICNFVSFSTSHFNYSFQSIQSVYRVSK